jgi:hypothetical protein
LVFAIGESGAGEKTDLSHGTGLEGDSRRGGTRPLLRVMSQWGVEGSFHWYFILTVNAFGRFLIFRHAPRRV